MPEAVASGLLLEHHLRGYIPECRSASLTTCNSIQPSTGKASTGKRFCQRLKRRRSRLVGEIAAEPGGQSISVPDPGAASSQLRGARNSKLRTSAALAVSSLW